MKKQNIMQEKAGKSSGLIRRIVVAQIAVQVGIALTPFWATTVQAAIKDSQDDRLLSGTAQHASGLAQAQQSGNLNGYVSQQAAGAASAEIQSWLQNFGTARVELGTDDRFKPHTGAVDVLIPLYKSEERLFFTQNGLRNKDGQFTGNFGLGQRHFLGDWMLGYNAFYDQNFSRDHKRLGTGVEAWRDYLKLSGNGYYRLSGWKNSVDVEDYDARPANGFDLRAEAWLPAYPAIGGKLMYEKYYGDEVALFGSDRRQKNPNAITAGLSYTPVPLVSLTADHKKGGSQDETSFGLQLTYQLGQSLSSQLDPSGVGLKRTLSGSGMDLVERNNNIVLEYRKQQLIDLRLPKEIAGASGMTVPVSYQLTSKYGLSRIDWNDATLVAAGGKVQSLGGGKYQLILPKYVAGTTNSYPLSGIAVDTRNNSSKVASTMVSVTRPAVNVEKSSIVASPETILANGAATSIITMTLADEDGQPVTGLAADLTATLKESQSKTLASKATSTPAKPTTLSSVSETGNGDYTLTLTSGTRPAVATVSPMLGSQALKSIDINQISDSASAVVKDGDLKLVLNNVVANGTAVNRAQARVTDATGNPVAGVAVTFTLSGSAQVATESGMTAVSDKDGYVNLSFTDKVAETVTLTATTENGGSAKVEAMFIADASTAALSQNDLTVDRVNALANGTDKVTYSALVKDANGNLVSGVTVKWATDGGSLSAGSSMTGADGKATMVLTNTVAGSVLVQGAVGSAAAINAPEVNFAADAGSGGIGQNDLKADKTTAIANGAESVTYTAIVKDANGNLLAGQTVNWQSSLGVLSDTSSVSGADGKATILLTSTLAGLAQVTANLDGKPMVNAPQVSFTADASNAQIGSGDLKVDKNNIVANNTDAAAFTAIVKDANGNPVANYPVRWATDRGNLSSETSNTNENGEATINLTGTQAGVAQVTAAVNGSAAVDAPQVTLNADSNSAQIGSGDLKADKVTAVADGAEQVTYTAIVKDANGNPVSNHQVSWTTDKGNLSSTSSMTGADGKATITLTSTVTGTAQVQASVNGAAAVNAPVVNFEADASSGGIGQNDLSVDKNTVVANGVENVTYTAVVKDANGNVLAGQTVNWLTSLGTLSGTSSVSDVDGKATITLTSIQAGLAQVTAALTGKPAVSAPQVIFTPDAASAQIGSGDLAVDKTDIVANNIDAATFTAIVKDGNGNLVPNVTVSWATDEGNLSSTTSITDDNGEATIRLMGISVGIAQVTATVNGGAAVNAPQVTLNADSSSAQIGSGDLVSDKTNAVANGIEQVSYTAVVKDANGNPVPNHQVDWSTDKGSLGGTSSMTDTQGKAIMTLTSTQAGSVQVVATLAGKPAVNAPLVDFAADGLSAQIGSGDLTVDRNNIIANNIDAAIFTAIVKDANGNPVANHPVSWATDRGNLSATTSNTDENGKATIDLTGTQAGVAQVTATVNAGAAVNAPQVTLNADDSSAQIGAGDLVADKPIATANGTELVTYTATVKDAHGNPVPNMTVTWGTDFGDLGGPTSTTNTSGEAQITLSSTLVGVAVVTAQPGIGNVASAAAVTFTADGSSAQIGTGDLTVAPTTVVANNIDKATYTAIVKDANGNLVTNHVVSWATDKGNLSGASSNTDENGVATITLGDTLVGEATVTATVNGIGSPAEVVTFIADVATAKVDNVVSNKAKITGTNEEVATLTATVTDANGNSIEGYRVNWSTSMGTVNQASDTDVDGKATATLTALHVATTNGTATVTAGDSTKVDVTVRAVLEANGKYYWTLLSDHPTGNESVAAGYCAQFGGGSAGNRADIEAFAGSGKDFKSMAVPGEFSDARYYVFNSWNATTYADYNSDYAAIGIRNDNFGANNAYVCVK